MRWRAPERQPSDFHHPLNGDGEIAVLSAVDVKRRYPDQATVLIDESAAAGSFRDGGIGLRVQLAADAA
jgi:hypothetical protein